MSEKDIPSRQLKNLIINPRVQFRLLAAFSAVFIVTVLTLYGSVYLYFWRFKEKALSVGIPEGHVFFNFLSAQKNDLDTLFLSVAIVSFIILIIVGIIISHRIAGPIQKLKNHLETMNHEADDFKLRENDFFSELGPVVNKLREKLKS
jgi:methyl-accepting chemotaxis protein